MYQNNRNLFPVLAVLGAAGLIASACGLFLVLADQLGGGATTISSPSISRSDLDSEASTPESNTASSSSSNNQPQPSPLVNGIIGAHTDTVLSIAVANATSASPLIASGSYDNSVKIWPADQSQAISLAQNGRVNALTFLPASSSPPNTSAENATEPYLATGSGSGEITLWNVAQKKPVKTIAGQSGRIISLAADSDGTRLASGSSNGTLKIWPLANSGTTFKQEEAITLTKVGPQIEALAFHPTQSDIVISGNHDGIIQVWDINSDKPSRVLDGDVDRIQGLSISNDGKFVASGSKDNQIQIWDLETGDQIHSLEGHDFVVGDVAFSPNGQFLASGSYDESIKLWNWKEEKEICTLNGHSGFVYSVAFANKGNTLISGGFDGSVRAWDLANCYTP